VKAFFNGKIDVNGQKNVQCKPAWSDCFFPATVASAADASGYQTINWIDGSALYRKVHVSNLYVASNNQQCSVGSSGGSNKACGTCCSGVKVKAFFAGKIDVNGQKNVQCKPAWSDCFFPATVASSPDTNGYQTINWIDGSALYRKVHTSNLYVASNNKLCSGASTPSPTPRPTPRPTPSVAKTCEIPLGDDLSCKEGKVIKSGSGCTAQCAKNGQSPNVKSVTCNNGKWTPTTPTCVKACDVAKCTTCDVDRTKCKICDDGDQKNCKASAQCRVQCRAQVKACDVVKCKTCDGDQTKCKICDDGNAPSTDQKKCEACDVVNCKNCDGDKTKCKICDGGNAPSTDQKKCEAAAIAYYPTILDAKSCSNSNKLDQMSQSMTLEQCHTHCSQTTSCTHFTWFQGVACRTFSSCPETGRYTTSTQPSATYGMQAEHMAAQVSTTTKAATTKAATTNNATAEPPKASGAFRAFPLPIAGLAALMACSICS